MAENQSSSPVEQTVQSALPLNSLQFTEIPRTTRLFNDYLYHKERVIGFYQPDGQRSLAEIASEIARQPFERAAVADALTRLNQRFGSAEQTFANIELLRQPGTVAIVTGQQAGLFTGPLFTIYKALTAIKIAEQLRAEGQPAVPVFWVASEDHDYDEVNHCRMVNKDGHLVTVRYDVCWPAGARSVGDLEICPEIEAVIDDFFTTLPESEFIPELKSDLQNAYRPRRGYAEGFAVLLARIFARYGVILLDPQDADLKKLAARVYAPALQNSAELAQGLVAQSQALETAGYHAQIYTSLDMVPLFLFDGEQRTGMVRNDECFTLKATTQCRSLNELLEEMQSAPGHFSPSVALRPVVQDLLLPTAAYVGGPAEVAYFAQLQPVYRFFQRTPPLIVPRASLTIIPERFHSILKKYNLQFEDLFAGPEAVMRKVIEGSLDRETTAVFEETEAVFQAQLDKLQESLSRVDGSLADALKTNRDKILYQIHNLRTRFINNSAKRDETTARQFERLFALLYPDKNLQERELNIYYFLARYGYGFIDQLYQAIDPTATVTGGDRAGHNLLYI